MRIWVTPLSKVHDVAARAKPARLVSLLSPGDVFPTVNGIGAGEAHCIAAHDVREETLGMAAPMQDHVRGLIAFLEAWSPDETLVVHCWAGVSRSTASAFIAACLHNPEADELAIARAIREASPTAWPNTRIVGFADDLLGRGGRMRAAIDAIGDGAPTIEAEPFSIPSRFAP
ncbi:MAG: protein tyrosine phosphatase [Alphaproteobacteria bacterium]|nr:protein tyrosine phosphatase [Alphaproteobacteria bacterium]